MSLILPENLSAQPEPSDTGNEPEPAPEPSRTASRLSWPDLALLTVVLGSLVALLVCGAGLQESVTLVGAAGLISAELRRRITS
ncbi:hypothetical protein ACFVZR_38315 [Streptomyces sp. NPDC058316]|uniref:hypothetical protein n=1 Tax=Streptomyces sp. NPDC058316 TaxID=3346442 RepID=UPI0036EC79B9